MKKEIIIDKYGLGHASAVLENGKMIDCFIDPPKNISFYPPDTFIRSKVERKVTNIGGYFVKLPNGNQGLLKSKNKYNQGQEVLVLSQVVFDLQKLQNFTDTLKTVTKYFIIKISKCGVSFSKKIPKDFDKLNASRLIESKIKGFDSIFVICRSSIANISIKEFSKELEKAINHIQTIIKVLATDHIYFDGLSRKVSLEKYKNSSFNLIEEEGIFERLGIWDQLEEIKKGRICLNNGAYLTIEQTNAFLAIDVNSGKNLKINKREINLNACDEISRLIKVFGFGGKILIDFLTCSPYLKREIYGKISISFSQDTVKNKIWGWTKSGIFEFERKREKIPLNLLI